MRATVQEVIMRYNDNRDLAHASKTRLAKLRQRYIDKLQWHINKLDLVEVSPEALADIQRQIREDIKRENKRAITRTIIFSVLVVAVVTVLAIWLIRLW